MITSMKFVLKLGQILLLHTESRTFSIRLLNAYSRLEITA